MACLLYTSCGRASQGVILVRTDSEKGGVIDIALADGSEEDEDISGAGEDLEEGAEETEEPEEASETEEPENER